MSDASTPRPRLTMLTFAPMVDSKKTRFLLWHYRLTYREERHIFGWASVLTFLYGGYGRIPMIYGDGLRLTGPRKMADRWNKHVRATCSCCRRRNRGGRRSKPIGRSITANSLCIRRSSPIFTFCHIPRS
jgi:hypothetical protein